MQVAISGSSGFIGSALRQALEADGHRTIALPRTTSERWRPDLLDGVDAVVNLAGAGIGDKRLGPARKRELFDSRIDTTTAIAEAIAAAERPPRVLLSGSAIGFYGDRGDEVLDERSAPQPGNFLSDLCVAWEAAADPAAAAGTRVAHLRTGLVLGPGGGALGPLVKLTRAFLGGPLGSGRQWWSWITLGDHLRAMRFLLESDVSGPHDLTAPEPVTNRTFAKALGRALGRPAVVPTPAFGPRLLLGRARADALLFASQRVEPRALEAAGFTFEHRSVDEALQAVVR